MKQCPRCHKAYSDEQLNFCLDDGELLSAVLPDRPTSNYADDPPTVLLNDPRTTNPYDLPKVQAPVQQWQPQTPQYPKFTGVGKAKPDQTLPTVALILGILSLPMVCCYGGIWLGIPAAVIGYMGVRNADTDSSKYGGRSMALGGMVTGIVSLLATLAFIILVLIGNIT